MPAKLDRCVNQVMAQGKTKDAAFAICNAALGEADWPEGITEEEKAQALDIINESMESLAESRNLGNWLESRVHNSMTSIIDDLFGNGNVTRDERTALMGGITSAMDSFNSSIQDSAPQLFTRDPFDDPEDFIEESEELVTASLVESGTSPRLGNLTERAVRGDGTINLKVIEPGWGSSGFYPAEVLERDGPTAFPTGTQMFWNHQTFTEQIERPEGDLSDFAAVLLSPATWNESGPEGAGLYADAQVFEAYRDAVNELAPHIGVSIRASGETKIGQAEGKRGPIVQSIDEGRSVDFVTQAGAGGQIVELFESKRGLNQMKPTGETVMAEEKVTDTPEVNANEQLQEANKRIEALERQLRVNESSRKAALVLDESLKDSKLPQVTIGKIRKTAINNVTFDEAGNLNEETFKTLIEGYINDETEYLKAISGSHSPVIGMGETGESSDEVPDLEEAFQRIGLAESAAKIAANAR